MYAFSLEGQLYPALHQKQIGQQVEGGDSAPVLHSAGTTPDLLHPVLELSAQKRYRPVGPDPEKVTKMSRELEHLCPNPVSGRFRCDPRRRD